MKSITPQQAKELLDEGYVYLDVRSIEEFEQGHPQGAFNVPIALAHPMFGMQPNQDFLKVAEANFPKDTKIICGCKTGGRSYRAAEVLEQAGYTTVINMDGGFHGRVDARGAVAQTGWAQENLPVSSEREGETSYTSLSAKAT